MVFAHDTELALLQTAALVNTQSRDGDELETQAGLDAFFRSYPFSGAIRRTPDELAEVRAIRPAIRAVWTAGDRDTAAALVNAILADADARPYLSKHDQWDWHLHLTGPEAPLAQRLAAEAAMGFLDVVRDDELDRLKLCAADDCDDVLVDLSRNSSKRYCDTGNCGNRANVAAYRARKRGDR